MVLEAKRYWILDAGHWIKKRIFATSGIQRPVSIQKFIYAVMPDLIRHPGAFEKTGFRLRGRNDGVGHDAIYGWILPASRANYLELGNF